MDLQYEYTVSPPHDVHMACRLFGVFWGVAALLQYGVRTMDVSTQLKSSVI